MIRSDCRFDLTVVTVQVTFGDKDSQDQEEEEAEEEEAGCGILPAILRVSLVPNSPVSVSIPVCVCLLLFLLSTSIWTLILNCLTQGGMSALTTVHCVCVVVHPQKDSAR